MKLALMGAIVLVLAGIGALWLAARHAPQPSSADEIAVTITDSTCEPADITVAAGKRSFRVHNASARVLEWEILDGVMVVAERENIAPGLETTLSVPLKPGSYQITCGLLSNPRGTLTVHETAESAARAARPDTRVFIGALSEYRVYLLRRASEVTRDTIELRDALAAGDTAGAEIALASARDAWLRMAPVWGMMGDLVARMDPDPAYLAEREADPAFTGFRRLERGLQAGEPAADLLPLAQLLAEDADAVAARLRALTLAPADLASLAAAAASRVGNRFDAPQGQAPGADLAALSAELDGITRPLTLVVPILAEADPGAAAILTEALDQAKAELKQAVDTAAGGAPTPPERARLAAAFHALAESAQTVNSRLGLE